ncbi:hypothetical protein ACQ4PT_070314 [Festuca glaucescens]
MASTVVVPLLLLLLLFSSCATLIADAAGADELNYIVVATSSLKAKAVCEGPRVNSTSAGFTNGVPVTRPHGPCSAAAAGNSEPSLVDTLRWDQQRASYIQRMLSVSVNASMPPKVPAKSPTDKSTLKVASTDPAAEFLPGTAKKKASQLSIDPAATADGGSAGEQTMVLDTASVFPWLQCAPCPVPPCHPQADTLYDPALSSTSGTFSCNSSACRQLGPFANGCANNQCQYRVRYVVTPMVKGKLNPALYVVRLQAITVAGQQLSVPPTIFAAGSVMDSRAPITRLPPTAYQALRSAFRSRMTMYRAAPPKEHLDTCYDFTGVSSIRLPKIALVFDRNAAVELDPSGVLFDGCLAFTSTIDDHATGIIGNVQQRTIELRSDSGLQPHLAAAVPPPWPVLAAPLRPEDTLFHGFHSPPGPSPCRRHPTRLSRTGPSAVSTALGTALGLGTLEYVIAVGLGTPSVRHTVLIDTGSDLSWVQCRRPCSRPPCHRQRDAVFDPSKSSTYSPFRCGSPACARLAADNTTNGCSGSNRCGYVVKYGDGSNTTGTYSSDTLTLNPSDVIVNFRFGCSHDITGFADTDRTDGLLRLGGDVQSLVSQAGKRAFSYCLPPTASHTGFFTLGVPRVSASRFAVTPLYRSAQSATFYFVMLQAITVAGRRLDVPPSVFSARDDGYRQRPTAI